MKNFTILILTILFAQLSFAQTMTVHKNDHTTTNFTLSQIDSITFTVRYDTTVPTQGLVAYYPFNGNANDSSGNNINGIISGAVSTTDRFGKANSALNFDGIDDYVLVAHNDLLQPITGLTVCAWVNVNAFNTDPPYYGSVILKKGGPWAGIGRYELLHWGPIFGFDLQFANGTDIRLSAPNDSIQLHQWYFLVMTYDGSDLRGYINTELVTSSSVSLTLGSNTDDMRMGLNLGNSSYPNPENGAIDDIRIYSRALSDAEIRALYHDGGW